MASPAQWTWVWASSGSWWWTGKPGMLQSLGWQRFVHDWANELNWTELSPLSIVEGYVFGQRRQWHSTPVLLPGKSHGRRSLVGCSPWGCKESDTTEQFPFHFLRSCIGEGNGNSFQCCCLENPSDGRAWWAAVYGVAQSQTWLKRLRSSSMYLGGSIFTLCLIFQAIKFDTYLSNYIFYCKIIFQVKKEVI